MACEVQCHLASAVPGQIIPTFLCSKNNLVVPLWCSRLGIQDCHCSRCEFVPWPRKFHMPWAQPVNNNNKNQTNREFCQCCCVLHGNTRPSSRSPRLTHSCYLLCSPLRSLDPCCPLWQPLATCVFEILLVQIKMGCKCKTCIELRRPSTRKQRKMT